MTKQELWSQFEKTGSIESYLAYCAGENITEEEGQLDEIHHRRAGNK